MEYQINHVDYTNDLIILVIIVQKSRKMINQDTRGIWEAVKSNDSQREEIIYACHNTTIPIIKEFKNHIGFVTR